MKNSILILFFSFIFNTIIGQTAVEYFNSAYYSYEQGDITGAISSFNKAIEMNPKYALAFYCRGIAKHNQGDYNGAITDYSKAIELDPNDLMAYYNRGYAREALGDKPGAINDWIKAKADNTDPTDPLVYNKRGETKFKMSNPEGAIADFTKAIELDPRYVIAYNNRGFVKYSQGEKPEAIVDFNKAIELNPNYTDAYFNRGYAKDALGNKTGAIADYTKAIELEPNYTEAYFNRGYAKELLGDKSGAITDYSKVIELEPKNAAAYKNRGYAKEATGDKTGAKADFNKAIQLDPKSLDSPRPSTVGEDIVLDINFIKNVLEDSIRKVLPLLEKAPHLTDLTISLPAAFLEMYHEHYVYNTTSKGSSANSLAHGALNLQRILNLSKEDNLSYQNKASGTLILTSVLQGSSYGTYSNGQAAFNVFYKIYFVEWPSCRIRGQTAFTSRAPEKINFDDSILVIHERQFKEWLMTIPVSH